MTRKIIGVFGGGNVTEEMPEWREAYEAGKLIAEGGGTVLTGGLGGVMLAASKGAREAGGLTVGILPGSKHDCRPNSYVEIAIYTDMNHARNVINVQSCDAAIAIGGEYGTLSEIALAKKIGCPVILLNSWHFTKDNSVPRHREKSAKDAREAVRLAFEVAGKKDNR